MSELIRRADVSDAEAILSIYAFYIEETTITFETVVPTIEAFTRRVVDISARYPFLVYELDGDVVGYAYAARHRERDAYRFDVELSVYVKKEYQGGGRASRLYNAIFALLKRLGYYNAYAVCTVPNGKSISFHENYGFRLIGVHHSTGYKLGAWRDVAWYEKAIQPYTDNPTDPHSIAEISEKEIADFLSIDALSQ